MAGVTGFGRLRGVIRPQDPPSGDRRNAAEEAAARLTPRLREVLDGFLAGESEKQLARRLLLSKHTVHEYAKQIYRHLDVQTRGELLALFMTPMAEPAAEPAPSSMWTRWPEPQRLSAPPADAPEEDHIYYCVNLLERRGFIVRYLEATRRFARRRRGLVAVMTLVLVACCCGLMMVADEPRRQDGPQSASGGASASQTARRINVSLGREGQAVALGPMSLGQRLSWRTTPEDAAVEVTVGSRLLLEPEHVIQIPGPLQVRAGQNEEAVVVHLTIEPPEMLTASGADDKPLLD